MTKLNVPDMHCNHCVERITKVLTEANLKFTVDLDTKSVTIDGTDADVETAISEMDDIGFESSRA